jgi:hypothetical protein
MKQKSTETKMGRPRKDEKVVRKSRGIRVHPDLLKRVDRAVKEKRIAGAHNWTSAVEVALLSLLARSGG